MNYYLGIDGGGTKTRVCLINSREEIIGFKDAGPSSIDTVENDVTKKHFEEAIKELVKGKSITAIFAGLGGVATNDDKEKVKEIINSLNLTTHPSHIYVENDTRNALASGLCFEEGISLIVGTGSVAFGKDTYGHIHKCGGWHYKEGDAGSSFDLGFQAIRMMVRAYDGRIEHNDFTTDVFHALELKTIEEIIPLLDELYTDRTRVAKLAPYVTKHANNGNVYALKIVENATDELALMISGVYKNLTLNEKKCVIVGSLGNAPGVFRERLEKKIKVIDLEIQILKPLVDPALGAALMAKHQHNRGL